MAKLDSGSLRSGDATLEHDRRVMVAKDSLELGKNCGSVEKTAPPDGHEESRDLGIFVREVDQKGREQVLQGVKVNITVTDGHRLSVFIFVHIHQNVFITISETDRQPRLDA